MLNANDVLIDVLEDNRRRLRRLFAVIDAECLFWKPAAEANSIAVTVWHMARILDVYLTQQAQGRSSEEECWFRNGWASRTKYDPRGHGQNGWGMLTGYTQAEVAGMPEFTPEQLIGYLDDVYDTVKGYLEATSIEQLLIPGIGFGGRYTRYQCIQMALLDNVRHLGEVFAIHASKDRHNQEAVWN
jgi:DinB superfamily